MRVYCGVYTNMNLLPWIITRLFGLMYGKMHVQFADWQANSYLLYQQSLSAPGGEVTEEMGEPDFEFNFYLQEAKYESVEVCPGSGYIWYNLPFLVAEVACSAECEAALRDEFMLEVGVLGGDHFFTILEKHGFRNPWLRIVNSNVVWDEHDPFGSYTQLSCDIVRG